MHQKILAALGWRNFGWTLRRASLKPQPLCIVFEAAGQRGSKHNTSGAFLCHRVQVAKLVGTCRCKCAVTVCTSYLLVPNVHREIFKGTVSDCVLATLVSVCQSPARQHALQVCCMLLRRGVLPVSLSGLSAFTCAPEDHSMSCQRVNVGGDWRPKRADRQGILQHAAISEAARKSLAVLATAFVGLPRLPACQAAKLDLPAANAVF